MDLGLKKKIKKIKKIRKFDYRELFDFVETSLKIFFLMIYFWTQGSSSRPCWTCSKEWTRRRTCSWTITIGTIMNILSVYTGWPVIHGCVILLQYNSVYTGRITVYKLQEKHGHVYLVGLYILWNKQLNMIYE